MKRCRIVERKHPDGRLEYVIQQKHYIFFWWWVDAWINLNSKFGASCKDNFSTLEEAKRNLCYFDGSTSIDKVVIEHLPLTFECSTKKRINKSKTLIKSKHKNTK